jgi:hypothetical protein
MRRYLTAEVPPVQREGLKYGPDNAPLFIHHEKPARTYRRLFYSSPAKLNIPFAHRLDYKGT